MSDAGFHHAARRGDGGGLAVSPTGGARGGWRDGACPGSKVWGHVGADINTLSNVMEVGDLVDAPLVGFDRREPVTIPPLPDAGQWDALQAARQAMLPNYRNEHPAERYRTVA